MKIILSYPIADFRKFILKNPNIINHPIWPDPELNEYFRSNGQVRKRRLGGVDNWIGENKICSSKRAIRFINNPFINIGKKYNCFFILRNRYFFFDSVVCGKYEIVFEVSDSIKSNRIVELLNEILNIQVKVIIPRHETISCSLLKLGKVLKQQYFYSTVSYKKTINKDDENYIIQTFPSIFIECSSCTPNILSNSITYFDNYNNLQVNIGFGFLTVNGIAFEIKVFHILPNANIKKIRALRIASLRVNALWFVLRQIIMRLDNGEITNDPNSPTSIHLQLFLKDIKNKLLKSSKDDDLDELSKICIQLSDEMDPGRKHEYIDKFRNDINLRPQLYNSLKNQIMRYNNDIGELNMSNSHITITNHSNGVITIGNKNNINASRISYSKLEEEVKQLEEKIDDEDIDEKDKAAKKKDIGKFKEVIQTHKKEKIINFLSTTGKWIIDFAKINGGQIICALLK